MKQVAFLAHVVSKGGISVDPSMVQDVLSWNAPMSVSDIQSFLGLAGYYRRFIEGFSKISMPMTELLEKDKKFKWTICLWSYFPGVEEATDNRSNISDARYEEVIFYLLWCIWSRTRMCTHARLSRGSVCFMTVEKAWSALSDPWFGVSCCSSHSQDLEALYYGKEVWAIYGS
jgi:hypothetical protein